MAFLTDTFTESSDTALGSHTPDVGGTWTVFAGGMTVVASEDRARGDSSSSSGAAYNSASPASDQYDVEAIVRRTTSDANPLGGIYARYDAAGPHYVQMYMSQPDSLLVMQEVQSGAVSESSTYSKTWTADQNYAFKIEARNGTNGVKGYLDGTQRVQITWSGGSTAGKAGIRARLYGRVDSLVATDYSTGVTLDCTVGNAVAAGSGATISAGTTINAGIGNAVAAGATANISAGTTINAGVGNAVAAGVQASITSGTTLDCTVGNAVAAGATANISAGTTINAGVGNAVAAGVQASITSGTTLDCTVGNAVAAGATANISAGTTINAGVGNAVAAGVQASITSGVTLECTVGNAVAAGVQAGISVGSGTVTIACAVGNAVADGVDVDIWSADIPLPRTGRIGTNGLDDTRRIGGSTLSGSRRIGSSTLRRPA